MPYYAVAKGKKTGVFNTWAECQNEINGFKGAVYKKFLTEEEAKKFVSERGSNIIDKRATASHSNEMKNDSSDKKAFSKDLEKSSFKRNYSEDSSDSASTFKKLKENLEDKQDDLLTTDNDGFLIIYTDGSALFNGRQGAQAGIGVYFGENHPMNVSDPVKGRATNNTAEIQAATRALKLAKSSGFTKVKINTDSQFMINCATSWLPNWKKNDWKKRDGSVVINKDDLILLDEASQGLLVHWNHVKAHDGLKGNEAADALARQGAKKYKAENE